MFKTRKKLLILIALILSLSVVAWFVLIHYASRWLEDRFTAAINDLRQKGYVISYSKVNFAGTPLGIQATLQDPHFKDPKGRIQWNGQAIQITVHPWQLSTLHYTLAGEQMVVIPQAKLQMKDVSGTVHLNAKRRPDSVSVTIPHLTPSLEGKFHPLTLKDVLLNVRNISEPLTLKVSLTTQVENVEKLLNKVPAAHPFTITILADFSGYKSEQPFPKSLSEWRDGGGVLEVRQLKIDWPPILAVIEGTLTLDEKMYPLGSFTSKITGYEALVNDMVDLGWIKKKHATVAMFMLDLLSSPDESGKKQLKAPITLQDKEMSVGPVRLMKMKPLAV